MLYEKSLCLVDMLSLKNETLSKKVKNSVLISCLKDHKLDAKFYKCEIDSFSFVLALLVKMLKPLEFKHLDEGYLSAEACLSEDEASEILEFLKEAKFIIIDKINQDAKYFLNILKSVFDLKIFNINEQELDFSQAQNVKLEPLRNYDGLVVFKAPIKSKNLHVSKQFLSIAKCKNYDLVELVNSSFKLRTTIELNENLQGTIGFLNNEALNTDFMRVSIKEVSTKEAR